MASKARTFFCWMASVADEYFISCLLPDAVVFRRVKTGLVSAEESNVTTDTGNWQELTASCSVW